MHSRRCSRHVNELLVRKCTAFRAQQRAGGHVERCSAAGPTLKDLSMMLGSLRPSFLNDLQRQ